MMTLSDTASSTSRSSTPPPAPVIVPDDEIVVASHGRGRPRRISRLLQQFSRIDALKSPARVKHEARAQRWRSVVASATQRSPSDPIIHDILDEQPLLSAGVGRHKSPAVCKVSPGARFVKAIALARSDKGRASSYLRPLNAQAKVPSPPKPMWRRSPRSMEKNTRWTRQNLSSIAKSAMAMNVSPRKRVSFQQPTQPTQQANDALDQFMQREPRATAQGSTPPATTSNLQALCLAKRRAVLLEMGVDESELHPSLRGYAAPRRQLDFTAVDALDTFMGGA